MKYELPDNHGLSISIIKNLVFKEGNKPALSDVQYEALRVGVGRDESALVVSPTSTGKTQIALWAIAKSIEARCNTVYLVTHRALAKQKFEDFKHLLLRNFLGDNGATLVIATGDYVENADGDIPSEPLLAPLVVATYEKYLALLSASGIPADMKSTVVVCDEIQLIGDAHRGQNVEVLLTLIRNAGWKQFVGLSAVLESRDAVDLANWLGVVPVVQYTREKHLRYECWTPKGIAVATSEYPDTIEEGVVIPPGIERNTLSILGSLLRQKAPPVPIIVFCMRKQDTYDLAEKFIAKYSKEGKDQLSFAFDGLPETAASTMLARTLSHRIAVHSADLMDEERHVVEQYLIDGKLDVVFATSTLAAGVNFPLGAAIFESWQRWNFQRRQRIPIESDEFHNMAGRVGRMGFKHEQGRVIFIATNSELHAAKRYLDLGALPSLEPRVTSERFNQLSLQLVASGLCHSKTEVERLVCATFSALREQDRNSKGFSGWPSLLSDAVDELIDEGLLIQTTAGELSATSIGKAVGYSGLLPETGVFLLKYAADKVERLIQLLPTPENTGNISRLAFLLFCACFSTPDFRPQNQKQPTRNLPYPLDARLFEADEYRDDLPEPVWQADPLPINAAYLSVEWINGSEIGKLEKMAPQLSAGMLRDMYRNLIWALQGFASIITAAADARNPAEFRPKVLRSNGKICDLLGRLPRFIRRISFRVSEGLPDDVLWMAALNMPDSDFSLSRSEIIALRGQGYVTPEKVMLGTPDADQVRLTIFTMAKPTAQAKANWLRDTCRNWKLIQRKRAAEKHMKRASHCPSIKLVESFYSRRGTEFEKTFEGIFDVLKIPYVKLDDKKKTGAPDYLVQFQDSPPLVIELKSKEGDKLIDYNKAVEVLAASEVHGYKESFCVTVCQPGVDPSVPVTIVGCGRLSVVESNDFGEALLRLCEGSLSQRQLWQWLASPGQALISDLPFRDYT